jgi:hypothetical protein
LTVARTVAAPAATPVIMPEDDTVANVAPALIDQLTVAPPTTTPFASRAVAVAAVD